MGEIRFGFRPYNEGLRLADISIEPLDDIDHRIDDYRSSGHIWNGWFEMPLAKPPYGRIGEFPTSDVIPLVPVGRVELPPSHILRHRMSNSTSRLRYLVGCIGFLSGMTLLPEGFGHLSRFPAERGKHGDFYGRMDEVAAHLTCFDQFFFDEGREASALLSSAIVHIQRSSSSTNFWDRFLFAYTAFDAIAATIQRVRPGWRSQRTHGTLPRDMCRYFHMPVPPRARTFQLRRGARTPPLGCRFSVLRNALFHEGRYYGRPAGEIAELEMHEATLDLRHLCLRLVLAIVGAQTPYTRTVVTSRQMQALT